MAPRPTRTLTAIIGREGAWWVALGPELDIASQGPIVEESRRNLTEAVDLFFETADPSEIEGRLRGEVFITQLKVPVG
jgi:predicted RNase H-like HicB family nuclease